MKKYSNALYPILFEIAIFLIFIAFLEIENLILNLVFLLIITIALYFLFTKTKINEKLKLAGKSKGATLFPLILLTLIIPFFFLENIYVVHVLTLALIFAIAVLGLNFQIGSAGMVNFAQGTLMGIGAYTSALLCTHFGVSFWIGLLAAIIVSAFFGLILGLPTLKTKEYHLSLVTIAFAYVGYLLILNMSWTGGPDGIAGIPKPKIFGFSLINSLKIGGIFISGTILYYYLVLIFLGVAIILARRIHYSWLGITWNAIRDDDIAAQCYGIKPTPYKLLSFVLGSIFAGVAGVLYAHFVGFISTESMAFSVDLLLVGMVILGGMDNIYGVMIGAFLLVLIPEKFRSFEDFRLLFYGIVLVLMLIFRPQGLFPKRVRIYSIERGKNGN